jgi:hypothetical protein
MINFFMPAPLPEHLIGALAKLDSGANVRH